MESANDQLEQRRRTHAAVAARLAALGDEDLARLLTETGAWDANMHGNQAGAIEVAGAKVFVKKIALTALEQQNERSTANLFDLPLVYQYGVGSAGFGAWRELAAYRKAHAWALGGEHPAFPLLYHWRTLPRTAAAPSERQLVRRQQLVDYWAGSEAVRTRLEAIAAAPASIVLFLEHVPEALFPWLSRSVADIAPGASVETTILGVHRQWRDAAAFMNARGMLHFDLNAFNLLIDGERMYAADFGLAICDDFDLSPAEHAFFETHRLYDRCYVDWAFAAWLAPPVEPPPLTPALQALVDRCAPVPSTFGSFIEALRDPGKAAVYPAAALEAALAAQARLPNA